MSQRQVTASFKSVFQPALTFLVVDDTCQRKDTDIFFPPEYNFALPCTKQILRLSIYVQKKNYHLRVMPVLFSCVCNRKQGKKDLYFQAWGSTFKGSHLQKLISTTITGGINKMTEGFTLKWAMFSRDCQLPSLQGLKGSVYPWFQKFSSLEEVLFFRSWSSQILFKLRVSMIHLLKWMTAIYQLDP